MIIKGLLRRYERWNPVHPTYGTFSGMGIGIGCGVGWGPGFGPEVIGYVGAGCGIGFSVGITLAGVGIGLPMNDLFQIPHSALATSSGALKYARSNALTTMKSFAGDSWNFVAPHIACLRREACEGLCSFKSSFTLAQRAELTEVNESVSRHVRSAFECLEVFRDRCQPPGKGQAGSLSKMQSAFLLFFVFARLISISYLMHD